MKIAGREIGQGHPPYIIAEISGNHNGDLGTALSMITLARDAGADAVKIQLYEPSDLVPDDHPTWKAYEKAKTPREWFPSLARRAEEDGITLFSSVFSIEGVRYLEDQGCPAYKIASQEIDKIWLLEEVKYTFKPALISTGMASMQNVTKALAIIPDCALLHCVSRYPCRIEDANLKAIKTLQACTGRPIGYSDHTPGTAAVIAAVALGSCIIEKHFKITDHCAEAEFSLDPIQFQQMTVACKAVWQGMGNGHIQPTIARREDE